MNLKVTLAVLVLLVCTGCAYSNPVLTAEPSLSPGVEVTPIPTASEASPSISPSEVALPLPSSSMFGLTGTDAVLYDAAVEFYSTRSGPDHLCVPSISILDTYEDDAGNTNYICWFRQIDYYNLAKGLSDLDNPQYTLNNAKELSRFTVTTSDSGESICTDIMEVGDGEGMIASIDTICGPKADLAAAIKNGDPLPVEEHDITPTDPVEILSIYLDYFFR